MGYGNWTAQSYISYRTTTGLSTDDMYTASVSQIYTSHKLNSDLDPQGSSARVLRLGGSS